MKFHILILILFLTFSTIFSNDSLSGKKILFDAIHDQDSGNSDWLIDTSYSSWAKVLENEGAEINAITGNWETYVIMDFDVLVIPEPQKPFSQYEKNIIDKMLKAKKGVFILSNGAGIDTNNDGKDSPLIINDLLINYGISCENNISGNPLSIKVNDKCKFIDNNTSISCWNGSIFKGNINSAISLENNNIFIGYSEINSGRLVVCGDSDMFGDGSGTPGDKLFNDYDIRDHKNISINIIKYLSFIKTNSNNETPVSFEHYYDDINNVSDNNFRKVLHNIIKDHRSYDYNKAREIMFTIVDNKNGKVYGVYSGFSSPSCIKPNSINCEHTWPQSKFTDEEHDVKLTDLFHLFPAKITFNKRRANYPFGIVWDADWQSKNCKLGVNIDNVKVFEPPVSHRGNIARALFYFSVRYGQPIDEMQEKVLRSWMNEDPVDENEIKRNNMIYKYQLNRNPFIDHPEYVNHISDF